MTTLGQRNNNYWNVKKPGSASWLGAINYDARGHAIFTDPAYGVRAVLRVLRTYQCKLKLLTLAAIFNRYAPSSDTIGSLPGAPANRPNAYAAFVARRLGVSPADPLNLFTPSGALVDPTRTKTLLRAMAQYENSAGFQVDETTLDRGFALFHSA